MGFKISSATFYTWPIALTVANDQHTFTAHFAFLPQPRIDKLLLASNRRVALLKRGEDDPELEGVTAVAIATEVLVGWSGVEDEDGPIEFTAATAERLIRIQGVAAAIVDAWGESLEGARRGNSKAPRGFG